MEIKLTSQSWRYKLQTRQFFPLLVMIGAILPFLSVVRYPFLYEWDDGGFVMENPYIALNWDNLIHNFSTNLQTVYTPVATFSLMLDHALYGLWAPGYHLTQLFLFSFCALCFFLILRRLRISPIVALLLTWLWAWNPCKCETVAWVADRKSVGAALFAFVSFWFFMRDCTRGRCSIAVLILMFIAFLFKPIALPLPGVMAIYAWCRFPNRWSRLVRLLWPVATVGIVGWSLVAGMTFSELSTTAGTSSFPNFRYVLRYLGATIWPITLNPIHPLFDWKHLWPELVWGLVILVGLYCASGISRIRYSLVFSVAFLGCSLPVLTSGGFTNADYCDRYGFLLSAVLWCWVGIIGVSWYHRFPQIFTTITVTLLVGYLLADAVYLETFSDTRLLFARAASVDLPVPKAIEGLALVAINRNDPKLLYSAGNMFREQEVLQPEWRKKTYRNMGELLMLLARSMSGDADAGRKLAVYLADNASHKYYTTEAFLPPAYSQATSRLIQDGRIEGAIALLDQQVKTNCGTLYQQHFAAGLARFIQKDYEGAHQEWTSALEASPGDAKVIQNLKRLEAMK